MATGPSKVPESVGLLLRGAVSLEADSTAAEVSTALRERGIRAVLLKGPALARWLYDQPSERTYVDADLLVAPDRLADARRTLEELGFAPHEEGKAPPGTPEHAEPWRRRGLPGGVDLHYTVFGCGVPPEQVWPLVTAGTEQLDVGGADLEVPSLEVRTLLVAIHAAQHGPGVAKPAEDLRRALAVAGDEVWAGAAALAEQLETELTFASGLGMAEGGAELARRLGLVDPTVATTALAGNGPLVQGFERMARARGLRSKLMLGLREAFPPPSHMLWRAHTDGLDGTSLPRLYARRLVWLARQAGPSIRARRRSYRG